MGRGRITQGVLGLLERVWIHFKYKTKPPKGVSRRVAYILKRSLDTVWRTGHRVRGKNVAENLGSNSFP